MAIDPSNKITRTNLQDLRMIEVSGSDRYDFLQGQLTQDMTILKQQKTALTGWATAKGRLLLTGQLFNWHESVWIVVPYVTAEQLLTRLRMFTLRAEVEIRISDLHIAGLTGDDLDRPLEINGMNLDAATVACATFDQLLLSRVAGDPARLLMIGNQQSVEIALSQFDNISSQACWNLANIRRGIPVILQETLEAFVPQMANLDLLNGISFTKGCYVGQEIVARTANLGRIKRRMFRYLCSSISQLAAGSPIHSKDGPAGITVSTAPSENGLEILAVIQLRLANSPLYSDETCQNLLTQQPLPYGLSEDDARK